MPGKKGSRVAASQARAKTNAKKKARSIGPDLSMAAREFSTEVLENEGLLEEAVEESAIPIATSNARMATATTTRPAPRAASRRERQAFGVISAGNLKREIATIGIITASSGAALAVVKLMTELGR